MCRRLIVGVAKFQSLLPLWRVALTSTLPHQGATMRMTTHTFILQDHGCCAPRMSTITTCKLPARANYAARYELYESFQLHREPAVCSLCPSLFSRHQQPTCKSARCTLDVAAPKVSPFAATSSMRCIRVAACLECRTSLAASTPINACTSHPTTLDGIEPVLELPLSGDKIMPVSGLVFAWSPDRVFDEARVARLRVVDSVSVRPCDPCLPVETWATLLLGA